MFSRDKLKALFETHDEPCVSIYLSTDKAGQGIERDSIRLKNLLRQAKDLLLAQNHPSGKVRKILEPAQEILEDTSFWQRQPGLALFFSSSRFHHYRVSISFQELVVVSNRFHLKPLIPLLTNDGYFYVLALSQNQVRLFRGDHYLLNEIPLERVPHSLAEALKFDDPQEQLQLHTGAPQTKGKRTALFHGHGVGTDDSKDRILRYFQLVDEGLHGALNGETVPLLLAAVEFLFPIYRQANTYRHLLDKQIRGNPEKLTPAELHKSAWYLVRPYFEKDREEAAARYRQLAGTGQSSNDLRETITAACSGHVSELFVAAGFQKWGVIDPESETVHVHDTAEPGDTDLLDFAAIQTLLTKGSVFLVPPDEVPGGAPLAAVFRYPIPTSADYSPERS